MKLLLLLLMVIQLLLILRKNNTRNQVFLQKTVQHFTFRMQQESHVLYIKTIKRKKKIAFLDSL